MTKLTLAQAQAAKETQTKIVDCLGKVGAVDEAHAQPAEVLAEIRVSGGDARRRHDEIYPDSNRSIAERADIGRPIIVGEFTERMIKSGHLRETADGRIYLGKPIRIDGKAYRPGKDVATQEYQRAQVAAQQVLDGGLESLFPKMDPKAYEGLRLGMEVFGYLKDFPVLVDADSGQILDGFNRTRAAEELGLRPEVHRISGSPLEKLMTALMANGNRRHDPKAVQHVLAELSRQGVRWKQITAACGTLTQKEKIELRRSYEKIRKEEFGDTQQEIADEVGVTQKTVSQDLSDIPKSEKGYNDLEDSSEMLTPEEVEEAERREAARSAVEQSKEDQEVKKGQSKKAQSAESAVDQCTHGCPVHCLAEPSGGTS